MGDLLLSSAKYAPPAARDFGANGAARCVETAHDHDLATSLTVTDPPGRVKDWPKAAGAEVGFSGTDQQAADTREPSRRPIGRFERSCL